MKHLTLQRICVPCSWLRKRLLCSPLLFWYLQVGRSEVLTIKKKKKKNLFAIFNMNRTYPSQGSPEKLSKNYIFFSKLVIFLDNSKKSTLTLIWMIHFVWNARIGCVVRLTPDSEKHHHFLRDKWRQIVAWIITKFYFDFKNKGHRKNVQ